MSPGMLEPPKASKKISALGKGATLRINHRAFPTLLPRKTQFAYCLFSCIIRANAPGSPCQLESRRAVGVSPLVRHPGADAPGSPC